MQIGEISALTGFSKDTIRWYEKIGLIQLDKKSRGENNYRKYDKAVAQKLIQIKQIKSFGFTLEEIKTMYLLKKHDELSCVSVAGIFQNRLNEVEEKIKELKTIKRKLLELKSSCTGNCVEKFYQ